MTPPTPPARPWGRGESLLALCLLFLACGPVDLVVVDVPDAGELQPPPGPSCSRNEDCLAGQFCETPSCAATLGRCAPRPLSSACPDDFRPECGCDGVTYWNGCLRRAAAQRSSAERGLCQQAPLACDTTTPCPGDASCARLVSPNECGRVAAGACWVVPQTCSGGVDHFFTCGQPQAVCLDLCGAVRAQQPAARFPGPCP
jgi:hypothetical protein